MMEFLKCVTIGILISAVCPVSFTQIISPQPESFQNLCPEEGVKITCTTRGSPILAWTSDEYIEQGGTQLEFATFNDVGYTRQSPVNPNTTAILINKTMEDDVQVLVSELRIIASVDSTVTCIDVAAGTTSTVSIQLFDDDIGHMPQEISTRQLLDGGGNCIVHLSLNAPAGRGNKYTIDVDGINTFNASNNSVYSPCRCESHNINITTINKCGRIGSQSTYNVIIEDEIPQVELLAACSTTPPPRASSTTIATVTDCQGTVVIVLATLAGFLFSTTICCIIITLMILRYTYYKKKMLRRHLQ